MVDCHNITSARARGLYSYRTLRYFWEHYKYKELKKKVLFQKFDQMFQKFPNFQMLGNVIISRKNIHIDRNLWRLQFASQVSLIDKFGDLLKL